MVGVTGGREVQACAVEEAVKEPGLVVHPLSPALTRAGQLGEVAPGPGRPGIAEVPPYGLDRVELTGSCASVPSEG